MSVTRRGFLRGSAGFAFSVIALPTEGSLRDEAEAAGVRLLSFEDYDDLGHRVGYGVTWYTKSGERRRNAVLFPGRLLEKEPERVATSALRALADFIERGAS